MLNEAPTLMNAESVQDLRAERASCTDDVPTEQGRSFDADDDDDEDFAASLQVQDAAESVQDLRAERESCTDDVPTEQGR